MWNVEDSHFCLLSFVFCHPLLCLPSSPSDAPSVFSSAPSDEPTGVPTEGRPVVCIESGNGSQKECQAIETEDSKTMGRLCLEVDESLTSINAEFTAFGSWRFYRGHLWVGAQLDDAPRTSSGGLELSGFPYNWSHTQGHSVVTQLLPMREATPNCHAPTRARLVLPTSVHIPPMENRKPGKNGVQSLEALGERRKFQRHPKERPSQGLDTIHGH